MATTPFWETKTLDQLSPEEWESLCDGCGLCCLRKMEDPDTGEIAYTGVSCWLLDCDSCRCRDYDHRLARVADCIGLQPGNREQLKWMPTTCAYRLVDAGQPLPEWHPLISGSGQTVHSAGISVRGRCVSEAFVHEDDIESLIVDWVTATD
jgi:hypothetical protein